MVLHASLHLCIVLVRDASPGPGENGCPSPENFQYCPAPPRQEKKIVLPHPKNIEKCPWALGRFHFWSPFVSNISPPDVKNKTMIDGTPVTKNDDGNGLLAEVLCRMFKTYHCGLKESRVHTIGFLRLLVLESLESC